VDAGLESALEQLDAARGGAQTHSRVLLVHALRRGDVAAEVLGLELVGERALLPDELAARGRPFVSSRSIARLETVSEEERDALDLLDGR